MSKPNDATLRGFAGQKGYTVERSHMTDHWRLMGDGGTVARNPLTGSLAFTIDEAMAFLKTRPDAIDWSARSDANGGKRVRQ